MSGGIALPLAGAAPAADPEDSYTSYSYSYPHKSAYGPLDPPVPLAPLWQAEDRRALFLYFHLPFCEMRCGFCNLFARAGAEAELVDAYLATLARQARVLDQATQGQRGIARLALGGGTPTFLSPRQLDRVFEVAADGFGARPDRVPTSVETSPKTATPDVLRVLLNRGVERVSIGVQSFVDGEVHAAGRPQSARDAHAALERLRAFPVLNIDLIYGLPGQTQESWLASLRGALVHAPEEAFVYPLYVRPQTGLARRGSVSRPPTPTMRSLYRAGRDLLRERGYEQVSMRYFRLPSTSVVRGPDYCCQTDGMIGLGCGARSYTTWLHYGSRFAVAAPDVHAILDRWIAQSDGELSCCRWGVRLSADDRRRRFVIQSLLTQSGLGDEAYAGVFGHEPAADFPELDVLVGRGLARHENATWQLTPAGLELSDWIGPRLYATARRLALEEFARA